MKLAVIGSRSYVDYPAFRSTMNTWFACGGPLPALVVSGGAKGTDSMSEQWAVEHSIPTQIFLPDWNRHGKCAGYLRNKDIVNASDVVVAFWSGTSPGTRHSIGLAHEARKPLLIIYV